MTKIRANQTEVEEILNDPDAGASETKKGTVEIATQAEVDTGTDTFLSITPATLANAIATQGGTLYEPLDATILKDADIGVTVQGFDATILVDADIGVTISDINHDHTGVYEPADVTILKAIITTPATGHVLTYSAGGNWVNTNSINIQTDGTLVVTTASYETLVTLNNDIPNKKYVDDAIGTGIGATALGQLSDVNLGGSPELQDGDVLTYSTTGSPSQWVHQPIPTGVFTEDANFNVVGGTDAGTGLTSGIENFFGGKYAGNINSTGNQNVFVGVKAGQNSNSSAPGNIGVGQSSCGATTTNPILTGGGNVCVGPFSGRALQQVATNNVLMGRSSGLSITTGDDNVCIGDAAGDNITTGLRNVLIGHDTGPSSNQSDKLFINNVASNTPLIHGDFVTEVITINGSFHVNNLIGSPAEQSEIHLHDSVNAAVTILTNAPLTGSPTGDTRFQLPANNGTGGYILQTDGSGNTTWVAGSSVSALDDLTDVALGSPTTNQVLTYNGANWINQAPAAGNNWFVANNDSDFAIAPLASTGLNNLVGGNNARVTGTGTKNLVIGTDCVSSHFSCTVLGVNNSAGNSGDVSIGSNNTATDENVTAIGFTNSINAIRSVGLGASNIISAGNTQSIVIGTSNVVSSTFSTLMGSINTTSSSYQTKIGTKLNGTEGSTNVSHSVSLGYNGNASSEKNVLRLFSRGKLEIVGPEAQYIFPNYAVTGSPVDVPASAEIGGVIYDSVAKGLVVYGGSPAGWSAVGGLQNIVEDTTPELGGNLVTGGHQIRTADVTTGHASELLFRAGNNSNVAGSYNSGNWSLYAGNGTNGNYAGYGTLQAGSGDTTDGGRININSGHSTSGDGGEIRLRSGNTTTGGYAGNIDMKAGTGPDAGGNVIIAGGSTTDATSSYSAGDVNLVGGSAPSGGKGGDINFTPGQLTATTGGAVNIHHNDGKAGQAAIRLFDDTSTNHFGGNYVELKAPLFAGSPSPTNVTFVLPSLDGSNGDVLQTDGSGNLSFAAAAGLANPLTANLDTGGYSIITATALANDPGTDITITPGQGDYGYGGGNVIINGGYGAGDISLVAGGYGNGSNDGGTILIKSGQRSGGGGDTVTIQNESATAKLVFNSNTTIDVTGQLLNETGTNSLPAIAFTSDPDTGMYHRGISGELAFSSNGTRTFDIGASFITSRQTHEFATGSQSTPSIGHFLDTDTGIYFVSPNEIHITTGGATRLSVLSDGTTKTASGVFESAAAEVVGGSPINRSNAFVMDTTTAVTTSGNSILSLQTAGTEKVSFECNNDANDYFKVRFHDTEATLNNFYLGYSDTDTDYAGMFNDHGDFWLGINSDDTTYVNFYHGSAFQLGTDSIRQSVQIYTDSSFDIDYSGGAGDCFKIHESTTNYFTIDNAGAITTDSTFAINNTLTVDDIDDVTTVTFIAEVANTTTTQTIDWTAGQKQKTTITAATAMTFTAPAGPCNLTLKVINGGLGTITWPATVKWPGGTEPSWTSSGTDICSFYFDGTDYFGMAGLAFA